MVVAKLEVEEFGALDGMSRDAIDGLAPTADDPVVQSARVLLLFLDALPFHRIGETIRASLESHTIGGGDGAHTRNGLEPLEQSVKHPHSLARLTIVMCEKIDDHRKAAVRLEAALLHGPEQNADLPAGS